MADPDAESNDFRRNQGERSLIEEFIRNHLLDVDHQTIEKGRPYTLACTKNDKSYHRAVAQRKKDKVLLAKLDGLD